MNQDKMYLINKLFNDKTIRTVWDKEKEYKNFKVKLKLVVVSCHN